MSVVVESPSLIAKSHCHHWIVFRIIAQAHLNKNYKERTNQLTMVMQLIVKLLIPLGMKG